MLIIKLLKTTYFSTKLFKEFLKIVTIFSIHYLSLYLLFFFKRAKSTLDSTIIQIQLTKSVNLVVLLFVRLII